MRQCSICTSDKLLEIQAAIVQQVPFANVASQFGLAKSSVHRHAQRHMGRSPRGNTSPRPTNGGSGFAKLKGRPAGSRPTDGRCPQCQQLTGDGNEALGPEGIIRRAERVLFMSEAIAIKAEASDDSRLALLAVDRCQRSIDTLAKIAGLLKPDNVTIIDQRQQNLYTNWPTSSLEALEKFHAVLAEGGTVADAISVVGNEKAPALPRPENDEAD